MIVMSVAVTTSAFFLDDNLIIDKSFLNDKRCWNLNRGQPTLFRYTLICYSDFALQHAHNHEVHSMNWLATSF